MASIAIEIPDGPGPERDRDVRRVEVQLPTPRLVVGAWAGESEPLLAQNRRRWVLLREGVCTNDLHPIGACPRTTPSATGKPTQPATVGISNREVKTSSPSASASSHSNLAGETLIIGGAFVTPSPLSSAFRFNYHVAREIDRVPLSPGCRCLRSSWGPPSTGPTTGQGTRTRLLIDGEGSVVGYFALAPHLLDVPWP